MPDYTEFYVVPAAEEGDLKAVRTHYNKCAEVDLHNPKVLLGAAANGMFKVARYLRNMGVNLRIQDDKAARVACSCESVQLLKMFADAGADFRKHMSECWNRASVAGHVNVLMWLADTYGAPPLPNQHVCLEWGIRYARPAQVRFVLDQLKFPVGPNEWIEWVRFALEHMDKESVSVMRMLLRCPEHVVSHISLFVNMVTDKDWRSVFKILAEIPGIRDATWACMQNTVAHQPWAIQCLMEMRPGIGTCDELARIYLQAVRTGNVVTMRALSSAHAKPMMALDAQNLETLKELMPLLERDGVPKGVYGNKSATVVRALLDKFKPDYDLDIAKNIVDDCKDESVFCKHVWPKWRDAAPKADRNELLFWAYVRNRCDIATILLDDGADISTGFTEQLSKFSRNSRMHELMVKYGMCVQ